MTSIVLMSMKQFIYILICYETSSSDEGSMKFIRIFMFASTLNIISDQVISLRQSNRNYPSIYPDGNHGHPVGHLNDSRSSSSHSSSKYRNYYKKIKKILRALQRERQLVGPNFRNHFGIGE